MWRLSMLIFYYFFTLLIGGGVIFATPTRRSIALFDDATIHTEEVGVFNRPEILAKFNLTEPMLSRIYAGRNLANKEAEADGRTTQYFNNLKTFRINDIKNSIINAIQNNHPEGNPDHPQHEMAAYPTCNSETTESSWLQDNNITIQFSQTLFEPRKFLNLDSATLRLYKINPNINDTDQKSSETDQKEKPSGETDEEQDDEETNAAGKLKRCVQPNMDPQIRVTISLVQQMRRNKRGVYERKKRICNTVMMNITQTGWVEIDIKRAIYIWEDTVKQLQQTQTNRSPVLVGWLLIEVHDEEEQPLKPGLFFKPPNCNQADIAIPWNYYRPDTAMPSFAAHEVPRYPRLDVKMIGYASFAPIHQQHNQQEDLMYANLKKKVFNMTDILDTESTTYISPTADNHLDSNDANTASITEEKEIQQQEQREHFQHKRHLKLEQLSEQMSQQLAQEEENRDERQQQQHKHSNKHHRQHHHRRGQQQHESGDREFEQHVAQHHNHHSHSHRRLRNNDYTFDNSDKEQTEIEQQQHDAKLLQHIAHKLQQEQKQLHLLHQQQQQQQDHSSIDLFNI